MTFLFSYNDLKAIFWLALLNLGLSHYQVYQILKRNYSYFQLKQKSIYRYTNDMFNQTRKYLFIS